MVSYALVTLGNAKTFLGINNGDKDELIGMLIDQATDYLETKCGRRFASTVYTNEEYDGRESYELNLKNYPIISFTSLSKNLAYDNSDDWETVDADDYWVENETGIITKTTLFRRGTKNYRATFTAGYATIPYDLQYACLTIVSETLNRRAAMGLKSESLGDHSITFESLYQSNPILKDVVSNYREIPLC
jgi:uncharacterized phiE125 gp8 family phage protein